MQEMIKARVRFKRGETVKYISHLDQNRAFARAVNRSKLPVWHTEGFNPHPYIVFSPPLSVGFTSQCEAMDFQLTGKVQFDEVKSALNAALPCGFEIYDAYEPQSKLSDIAYADYSIICEVAGIDAQAAAEAINQLFGKKSIIVLKKTKKGEAETDIRPLVKSLKAEYAGGGDIAITATLSADPEHYLNPEYLLTAAKKHIDGLSIEYASYDRLQLYNGNMEIFR